jgi:hypothetical protein
MQDYFATIFESINRMLTQHASFFESMGINLFRSLAAIMISWFGVQAALSGASGSNGFPWSKFSTLVMEIGLCYTLLAFYSTPIPGIGVSFVHLVLDQVQFMVGQMNQARAQELIETLNDVEMNLPYPTPYEIFAMIRYTILVVCIVAAQAVTLVVIMYGYVATAVIVLVGPVFIPFKIVPQMDWMFWGWLRAFIQHAFYQFIASAYIFVFGDFLMQILGAHNGPLSAYDMAALFLPLVLVLVTFILGTIKIPALTYSIFAGRGGEYVFLWWR